MPDAHSLEVVYPEASSSLALGCRGIAPLFSPPFLLGEVLSNSVAVLAGPQDKARDRSNPLALCHEHPSLSGRPHVHREACTEHASEHPKNSLHVARPSGSGFLPPNTATSFLKPRFTSFSSITQLHPMLFPQLTHLWHVPLRTVMLPHTSHAGASPTSFIAPLSTDA